MNASFLYSRRIISVIFWLLLSVASVRGWKCLASSLKAEDPQIWMLYNNASLLDGSWIFFATAAVSLSLLYSYEIKNFKPERLSHILFWVAALGLAAVFIYPVGSLDHFAYAAYSHLHAHYGINPYQGTVSDINNYLSDPFLKNMWWIFVTSVYGPLWTWISYVLYQVFSGFGLVPLIFGFKMLGLLMHILITLVVYRLAEAVSTGNGPKAAMLYGMNPLAIFELVVNAHNDGTTILLLIISLLMLIQKRYFTSFVIAGMSAACKMTTGIAILFLVWKTANGKGIWYARLYTFLAVLLVAVMYLAFFNGTWVGMLNGLKNPLQGFISNSLVSIPYALGCDYLITPVRIIGLFIFGFFYIYLLKNSQVASNDSLIIIIGLGFVNYYLFGAYVVHRWYFIWPLAIMANITESTWTKAIIGQSLLMFISYTHILVFGETKEYNAFTYLLAWIPLMYLWISRKKQINLGIKS